MKTATLYQRFRSSGYSAVDSARSARIVAAFREHEGERVRLRAEPEEEHPFSVYGDPEGYTDASGRRVSAEEETKEIERLLDLFGCWRIVAERKCSECSRWEHVDSFGMLYGYKDPLDPVENPYVVGLMRSALRLVTHSFRKLA